MLLCRCVRRVITRPRIAQWVFVFSTMSASPRVTRKSNTRKSIASRFSIGMFITATAHRESFMTMHQYPWYPGTGSRGETGQGKGRGYTLNVPLRALTPTNDQRRAFESAIEDIASKFTPDFIIISAGFDAHRGDPLGQLLLTDEDFVQMTRVVKQWADETCRGRVISCMEGGYNLETLGETVRAHVRDLQA